MILTLRPHHILCRLGFQGYGYSPEFINEMAYIVKIISSGRVKTIIVRPGYDSICRSCPHLEYECSEKSFGPRGRNAMEFDRRTMRALKLKPGYPYPLPEIDERISKLTYEQFSQICAGCEWQQLGSCAQGQLLLHQRFNGD